MPPELQNGPDLLGEILRNVSRSFYLTLRVLPKPVRRQIGIAYLLARAADSIADTELIGSDVRLSCLMLFRSCVQKARSLTDTEAMELSSFGRHDQSPKGSDDHERRLLLLLPECFQLLEALEETDRRLVIDVVVELTRGMEKDLNRFPDNKSIRPLLKFEDLEEYTYYVAGCVGPFWTKMCIRHLAEFQSWDEKKMCELGIRFGKALQWTNVLRDMPKDLSNGRCYIPSEDLARLGLRPIDLTKTDVYLKFKPLYLRYLEHALDHFEAAWCYTREIPKKSLRLKLACIWPQWIGLQTIALLRNSENPLDPANRIKISRNDVYKIMIRSSACLFSTKQLESYQSKLMSAARGK